jgi:predicted ATPase
MTIVNSRLFVISGAPISGKTTLIEELQRRGFLCARDSGSNIHCYSTNQEASLQLKLERMLDSYREHTPTSEIRFSDTGVVDLLTAAQCANLPDLARIQIACKTFRYNPRVFVAPPWEAIYRTKAEHSKSFEQSVKVYEKITEVYAEFGYTLDELPCVTAAERADFVLANMPASLIRELK